MALKEKSRIWPVLLVLGTLLLGVGIQLGLGLYSAARSRAAGARLLEAASEAAVSAAENVLDQRERQLRYRQESFQQKTEKAEALEKLDLLILVNPWNPLPEGYEPALQSVGENQAMDARCAGALLQMLEDCRAAGNHPYICSTYRSQETQQALYDNKILRLILSGVSWEEAPEIAARSVAVPGTSEHQLGLAADIIDEFYTNLDAGQENTGTQQWLMENSWRYGFVLRYPNGSTGITGIIYEPWHYRYVGTEFAGEIYESGLTLEEYIVQRRGR